jgi:hypothetical protein
MDEVEARIKGRDMAVDKLFGRLGISGRFAVQWPQGVGNCDLVKSNGWAFPHEDKGPGGGGIVCYPRAVRSYAVGRNSD